MDPMALLNLIRFSARCCVLTFFFSISQAAEKPYNVVFLLADDFRFDTLGVAGNPIVKTPSIDQLAAEGMRFTHACVTTSICGVSRSSFLSGQWMSRHGNRSFKAMETPWSESYPGLLRKNGYHTGHVGKWHSGAFPQSEFDFGRSYQGKHWRKQADGSKINTIQKNENDALEFLKTRPKDKPFMLNLWFFAPHAEDENPGQFLPRPESMKLYEDVRIPIPPLATEAAFKNLPPFIQQEKNEARIRFHWRFDEPEKYQKMMKNYYRLCTELDTVCGRVISELKKQGVLENTIIVFSGDNGYYHGDRGLADKWYPHDESIRVPLIIYDPRLPAASRGKTNDEFVLNVDVAPTILAAMGIESPATMQGRDFSPLYLDTDKPLSPPWRSEFFYEHGTIGNKERIPSSEAVVRKDMKYTNWPEWNYEELFDLSKDPLEQNNLVKSPENSGKLTELRTRLTTLKAAAR